MSVQYSTTNLMVSNEMREILIVQDKESPSPLIFEDLTMIVAKDEGKVAKIYVTEGYIFRTYPPEEGYPYYTYWFLLAKDQGAADIANQLAQDNAVLQEAANILMGVE